MVLPDARPALRQRRRLACVLVFLLLIGLLLAALWLWPRYRARQEWHRAESALARHDLPAALTHLDLYLSDRPDNVAAWFLAARTARRLERGAEAERYLERCQQLGGVTDATRLEWDLLRVQRGDLGGIDVRLRKSIGPEHPDALIVLEALARGYIRSERLTDALEACQLWIARQPDHPWPWLWRGNVYDRLNHQDRAVADYQRAVQNNPLDSEARLTLAGLLFRQRQPRAAAEQYEVVLARVPDDLDAQIGLAACRIEQGRAAEAITLLDGVLEQGPGSAQAVFLRGKAAVQVNQPASAERWLREATRLAPSDPEALYQLSLALRAQRKEEEAKQVSLRAERLRKDYQRLEELTRMIARQPSDPQPRHEAGVIALRLGRTDEGLRFLHSLLPLDGDHRRTQAVLADHYQQKGNLERAEYHRRLAETPPR
jgi:tetratricopeptide (TPR) repeat protein